MVFIQYPPCTTCQKAKKWLDDHNLSYEDRHIKDHPPTYEELKDWYTRSGLPLKRFFNTSGLLYKSMNLKDKLPDPEEDLYGEQALAAAPVAGAPEVPAEE